MLTITNGVTCHCFLQKARICWITFICCFTCFWFPHYLLSFKGYLVKWCYSDAFDWFSCLNLQRTSSANCINPHCCRKLYLQPVWELAPLRVIQMHYSAGIKKLKNQIDLKVKIAAKVWFCGGCALKWYLNSSDEGFWKSEINQCWELL